MATTQTHTSETYTRGTHTNALLSAIGLGIVFTLLAGASLLLADWLAVLVVLAGLALTLFMTRAYWRNRPRPVVGLPAIVLMFLLPVANGWALTHDQQEHRTYQVSWELLATEGITPELPVRLEFLDFPGHGFIFHSNEYAELFASQPNPAEVTLQLNKRLWQCIDSFSLVKIGTVDSTLNKFSSIDYLPAEGSSPFADPSWCPD